MSFEYVVQTVGMIVCTRNQSSTPLKRVQKGQKATLCCRPEFKLEIYQQQISNSFHAPSSRTMKLEYVAHQMAYYQKILVPLRLDHCGETRFPIGPQTRASGGSIWAPLQVHRPSFEAFGPLLWKRRGPEGGEMPTFKAPPLPQ